MKVVENSPQNTRNCTIFFNFLGGGGHAPNPLATDYDMLIRGMYIQIPPIL